MSTTLVNDTAAPSAMLRPLLLLPCAATATTATTATTLLQYYSYNGHPDYDYCLLVLLILHVPCACACWRPAPPYFCLAPSSRVPGSLGHAELGRSEA
eukprot:662504-Pyramimonas_sp.AAC.1